MPSRKGECIYSNIWLGWERRTMAPLVAGKTHPHRYRLSRGLDNDYMGDASCVIRSAGGRAVGAETESEFLTTAMNGSVSSASHDPL